MYGKNYRGVKFGVLKFLYKDQARKKKMKHEIFERQFSTLNDIFRMMQLLGWF